MARARLLKPGFFTNETLAEVEPLGRLLFAGLWTLADRAGRLEDRPKRIKAELFAYDSVDVDCLLSELTSRGFIQRYEVEGERYIQVTKFEVHQNPHVKERASTIPAPYLHSASTAFSGTSPAEALNLKPIPDPKADTESPPAHPFALTYTREHQRRNAGRPPNQTEQAAALALEREYGADACIELAQDLDWQKHPNYMRPILKERRDGNRRAEGNSESASGTDTNGLAGGVRGMDERLTAQLRAVRQRTAG